MYVEVEPAVGHRVGEVPPGFQVRLRQEQVAQEAAALALACLGAHPDQVPVAGVLRVGPVLDVIPLGPELLQEDLVDLAVVADRVQAPARLRQVKEDQVPVRAERPLVPAVAWLVEPQTRLVRGQTGRGDELHGPPDVLGDGHQAGALDEPVGPLRRGTLAVLAAGLAPEAEAGARAGGHFAVAGALDHAVAHVDLPRAEGGQVLDQHRRDAMVLEDRLPGIVLLEHAHAGGLQGRLHDGLPAARDVAVERAGRDLGLRRAPGLLLRQLGDDARLGREVVVAVGAGDVDADVRPGVAPQHGVLLQQHDVAPGPARLDGRATARHAGANDQHVGLDDVVHFHGGALTFRVSC